MFMWLIRVDQTKLLEDERLRWKVSLCIGAAWIGLSLFGWMGTSVKSWWHDFSWKWERDHAPKQEPAPGSSTEPPSYTKDLNPYAPYQVPPNNTTSPNPNPFGPVGPPPDANPNMLPNGVMRPLDNSHVPVPKYPAATTTTPGIDIPEFKWKPTTPTVTPDWTKVTLPAPDTSSSPSLLQRKYDWLNPKPSIAPGLSPSEQVQPKLSRREDSTKPTEPTSLDFEKYLKH